MVNRLLPSYAPPKEGRTHAYSPKIKQWQRSNQFRILVLLLGVVATYVVFSPFFTSSGDLTTTKIVAAKDAISKPFTPKVAAGDEHRAPSWAQDELVAKHEPERISVKVTPKQVPVAEPEDYVEEKPKAPASKPKAALPKSESGYTSTSEDSIEFQRKLQKVISLVPDEVNTRELLREPEGTGKERLREMGLRTRAFKKYFEAWEALHLVTDGDSSRIRDDVVQYSRTIMNGQALAETMRSYQQFRYFFQRLSSLLFPWTMPYWADHMTLRSHFRNGGRGIVLSAGDDQAPYLLTSIQTFRKLGCTLPIEVMYLGDSDLDEDYRQQLEDLPDVVTRDMSQMIDDEGWRVMGWAGKPFAILMSSFREVIFIDADSLFFEDPAVLFNDPGYVETGALFFRDRKIMPESKKRWLQQLLPKPISRLAKQSYMWTGESGHYQESGVVVVDKWKHFVSMLLVTRMNGPDRDSNKEEGIVGVYDMVYGDKETYWLAWELSGDLDYSFHQGPAGIMGKVEEHHKPEPRRLSKTEKKRLKATHPELNDEQIDAAMEQPPEEEGPPTNFTICAPQLLHLNLDGSPLWFNGWIMAKKEGDKTKEKFSTFERYLAEPKEKVGEDDAWKLHQDNICCLTADETKEFTTRHRSVLDMIISVAQEVKSKSEV